MKLGKKIKIYLLFLIAFTLILTNCGTQTYRLHKVFPSFIAPTDKALVIIMRSVTAKVYAPFIGYVGGGGISEIYVDAKFATGTRENSAAIIEVEPGEHYIIAKTDTKSIRKFNFKAGKTYYLLQTTFPLPLSMTGNTIVPVDKKIGLEVIKSMKEKNFHFVEVLPTHTEENLTIDEFNGILSDWEKIEQKDLEEANKSLNYSGY